jgi:ATP-dependent DNA ligase
MAFENGERLFRTVCELGLEGVVAKGLWQRYKPGERGWVKVKNRDYWRFPLERESAIRSRRRLTV